MPDKRIGDPRLRGDDKMGGVFKGRGVAPEQVRGRLKVSPQRG